MKILNYKIVICIIIVFLSSLTGCINEEEPKEKNQSEIALEFVDLLSNNSYSEAYNYFNSDMSNALSLDQLEAGWHSIIDEYGDFIKIENTRETEEGGYNIIYATCNFSILGFLDVKIVFDTDNMITGLWFIPTEVTVEYEPPEYADLNSFTELNITIGSEEWLLPGTLTIPTVSKLSPVVILVHGSGPNDRDESIGPNKPFKDLAWGLASKGIAVLRYEKRTKEYPEQSSTIINLTVQEEIIDDALAAVEIVHNLTYIDQNSIYVLGHSLGGMIAPRIAEQNEQIAGLIILAGNTRGLEDLFLEQTIYLANLDGNIDENEQTQIDTIEEQVKKIKTLNISENEIVLGAPKSYWLDLANYNPIETAKYLNIPMFILQGERDYQVTINGDFINWNMTFSNNENVSLKTYETLNHLFISGSGTPNNSEYLIDGHISEEVIIDIANWINNK